MSARGQSPPPPRRRRWLFLGLGSGLLTGFAFLAKSASLEAEPASTAVVQPRNLARARVQRGVRGDAIPHGKMAKLREKGAVHRNGRRRGPKRRGVTVDMVPTTETVELADLTAPPGRLWLPVALGRAKRRAHAATENEEAYNNFLITFCLLNTTAYHAEPWLYGMSIFLQQKSGCLEDKSLLRTYKLPVVEELLAKHPGRFLDPSGFIYHETRCGSTLAANMLAAVPTNIMNSESPIPEVAASACRTCTEEVHLRLVRSVLRLMIPAEQGHTHSFFKFN